jgi:hypothetical protein
MADAVPVAGPMVHTILVRRLANAVRFIPGQLRTLEVFGGLI